MFGMLVVCVGDLRVCVCAWNLLGAWFVQYVGLVWEVCVGDVRGFFLVCGSCVMWLWVVWSLLVMCMRVVFGRLFRLWCVLMVCQGYLDLRGLCSMCVWCVRGVRW